MTDQPALITAAFGRRGWLETDSGEARRFLVKGKRLRVVCGDQVHWQTQSSGQELLVTDIAARDNALERLDPRGRTEVIAANLTALVVVAAPSPAPDFFLLDRFVAAGELMDCNVSIVWNKADLDAQAPEELRILERLGYPLLPCSAETGDVQALRAALDGQKGMLVGQSGVGKSSLTNALVPDASIATSAVSEATAEGVHTTTASAMHTLPGSGRLIDSPGVRDFMPSMGQPERVQFGFREIADAAAGCRFSNCQHMREPDCAVAAAVESGEIDARRYESYRRAWLTTQKQAD